IQVQPKLSVSEGHYVSEKVRASLIKQVDEVTDVMVHIDPEDDEKVHLSDRLPPREKVLENLHSHWSDIPQAKLIERITLHYLDGKIHVELLLPLEIIGHTEKAKQVAEAFANVAKDEDIIANIRVLYS
ncbi:cation transporter dimerization domain-containing protein, partial [Kaarinaea lacus]